MLQKHAPSLVLLAALLGGLAALVLVVIVSGPSAAASVRLPDIVIGLAFGLAGVTVPRPAA